MFPQTASQELKNPPSVSWKMLLQEVLALALFIAVVSLFI